MKVYASVSQSTPWQMECAGGDDKEKPFWFLLFWKKLNVTSYGLS